MPLSFMYSLEEETYVYDIKVLLSTLLKSLNKILYISFNKTGDGINSFCTESGIDTSKLVIIDMISPRIKECKNTGNVYYVEIEDIAASAKQIIRIMEDEACNSFLLDSLSTMSIYYDDRQLLKFAHELIIYTESRHLISNIIIQRHDEKKEWLKSIIPLVGEPKEVRFISR
jgi:hypothetical protein